MPVISQISS